MHHITCLFELNNQRNSRFSCTGFGAMIAYSGDKQGRNNPDAESIKDVGPIPKGTYYIVDRQSGGRFGAIRDLWWKYGPVSTDRTRWFALWHPGTGDYVMVSGVRRGEFRLHSQAGEFGRSEGCIVILDPLDFDRLERYLRSAKPEMPIPGSRTTKAYGTVEVR